MREATVGLPAPAQLRPGSDPGIPGIQSWAEIIEAVQSPLGLIVLLVLVVGTAAFALFGKEANSRVRLIVFASLWLGAAGIILLTASSRSRTLAGGGDGCRVLDEAAFAEVRRATGLDRDAMARADFEGSELAAMEYRIVLEEELRRKGYPPGELGNRTLRELVLRARAECIIP